MEKLIVIITAIAVIASCGAVVLFALGLSIDLSEVRKLLGIRNKVLDLKDVLIKRESLLGGVVILTESGGCQMAGRITDITRYKSGSIDKLEIETDVPYTTEKKNDFCRDISIDMDGRVNPYHKGGFVIIDCDSRKMITLVTKDKADEFIKWSKEYHAKYAVNTLGW